MTATELLTAAAISLLLGVVLAPFVSRLVLAVGVVGSTRRPTQTA